MSVKQAKEQLKIVTFESTFARCKLDASCDGWSTEGFYLTRTGSKGGHLLYMGVKLLGPQNLYSSIIRQTWAISTTEGKSEIFSCKWYPTGENIWNCMAGEAKTDVVKWHGQGFGLSKHKTFRAKGLIKKKNTVVIGNAMILEAYRKFEQPKKYATWKLEQKKPFFISFAAL